MREQQYLRLKQTIERAYREMVQALDELRSVSQPPETRAHPIRSKPRIRRGKLVAAVESAVAKMLGDFQPYDVRKEIRKADPEFEARIKGSSLSATLARLDTVMVAKPGSGRRPTRYRFIGKAALLLCILITWPAHTLGQNIPLPGRLDNTYTLGTVSFQFPQNWQVLDKRGEDDVLIGPPEGNLRQGKERKKLPAAYSHGILFGYFEPHVHAVESAADELLLRLKRRYYNANFIAPNRNQKFMRANGRPALLRPIDFTWPYSYGTLFLVQDGDRAWYWLPFTPFEFGEAGYPAHQKEYLPVFAAILVSISIDGKVIAFDAIPEDQSGASGAIISANEIAKRSLSSVVVLVMQGSDTEHIVFGTGFFVGNGLIATNFHVVKGARQGYARLVGHDTRYQVLGVVAVDEERDLALLSIGEDNHTEPLRLSQAPNPAVGDTVYVIGNPEGFEGTFSQGIISSIRDGFLQITAAISHGSSGGPVLDRTGAVIGVATATYEGGQNLNFAIPVSELTKLLSRIGPVVPLGRTE